MNPVTHVILRIFQLALIIAAAVVIAWASKG